jgi:iron complex outermembrane receptor protein
MRREALSPSGPGLPVLFLFLWVMALPACAPQGDVDFDIPAGSATVTLKEFAKQSGLEIIYTAKSVESVTTNALQGSMHPREGLERLLTGTPLFLQEDPVSGAFAVMRASESEQTRVSTARPSTQSQPK